MNKLIKYSMIPFTAFVGGCQKGATPSADSQTHFAGAETLRVEKVDEKIANSSLGASEIHFQISNPSNKLVYCQSVRLIMQSREDENRPFVQKELEALGKYIWLKPGKIVKFVARPESPGAILAWTGGTNFQCKKISGLSVSLKSSGDSCLQAANSRSEKIPAQLGNCFSPQTSWTVGGNNPGQVTLQAMANTLCLRSYPLNGEMRPVTSRYCEAQGTSWQLNLNDSGLFQVKSNRTQQCLI